MPHVIVKLWPGKSEQQKTRLAEAITKCDGHFRLRRRIGLGGYGRNQATGLGGGGL